MASISDSFFDRDDDPIVCQTCADQFPRYNGLAGRRSQNTPHTHNKWGDKEFPNQWHSECDIDDEMDCGCVYSHNPILGYPIVVKHCGEHIPAPKANPLKADPNTEYAFTLTMPPDYNPKKPIEVVARLIMEHGLTNNPIEKAAEWAFVLEHTEAGTPHIHGVYRTPSGRRISAKYFKRYWPLWDEKVKLGNGHKGGYHAKARSGESYKGYMEKEGVVVKNPPAPEESPDLISHV